MNRIVKTEIESVDSELARGAAPRDTSSTEKVADGSHSVTQIRRATGPRTRQGKERSKYNALKHGVFSAQVVLPDESKAEFHALLDGLRNDFQPKGTLEDVLVEKLAALFWRNRRLIIAESAEIQKGVKFLTWDKEQMGLSSIEEYQNFALETIQDEVKRLKRYESESARAGIESSRMELDALSRNVPDAPQLDRLLRYEAAISREIDRTLNQLERFQRMRRGQPVPPPINVNVTAS